MKNPTISVIMACRNEEDFISQAIESILGQTYADFELLVMDDGSTDSTADIVRSFAKNDPRIILFSQKNKGLTKSLNMLIKQSKGVFIARQDADDWSHPHRFQDQIEFFAGYPALMMCGTACLLADEKSRVVGEEKAMTGTERIRKALLKGNRFNHGSVMFRKSIIDETGMYNETFKYGQDYEFFTRISRCFDIDNINVPLYYYRLRSGSISGVQMERQLYTGKVIRKLAKAHERGIEFTDDTITRMLENGPAGRVEKALLRSDVCLAKAKNCYLLGQKKKARDLFMKAFLAVPNPKTLAHFAKTLV